MKYINITSIRRMPNLATPSSVLGINFDIMLCQNLILLAYMYVLRIHDIWKRQQSHHSQWKQIGTSLCCHDTNSTITKWQFMVHHLVKTYIVCIPAENYMYTWIYRFTRDANDKNRYTTRNVRIWTIYASVIGTNVPGYMPWAVTPNASRCCTTLHG